MFRIAGRCSAVVVVLLLGELLSFVPSVAADDTKRPNIVFAFADDWGRHAGVYAKLKPGGISDLIETPNFDRVATEGMLFTNAFVTSPSCTPCRSSLLSGQYFFRTGLRSHSARRCVGYGDSVVSAVALKPRAITSGIRTKCGVRVQKQTLRTELAGPRLIPPETRLVAFHKTSHAKKKRLA